MKSISFSETIGMHDSDPAALGQLGSLSALVDTNKDKTGMFPIAVFDENSNVVIRRLSPESANLSEIGFNFHKDSSGHTVNLAVSVTDKNTLVVCVDYECDVTYKGRKYSVPAGKSSIKLGYEFSGDFGEPDAIVTGDPELERRKERKDRLSRMGRSSYGPQNLHRRH